MSLCWHIVNLTPFTYRFGEARYVCCGTLYANSSGADKTIRLPGSYVSPPPPPSVKRTATQRDALTIGFALSTSKRGRYRTWPMIYVRAISTVCAHMNRANDFPRFRKGFHRRARTRRPCPGNVSRAYQERGNAVVNLRYVRTEKITPIRHTALFQRSVGHTGTLVKVFKKTSIVQLAS